MLSDLSADIDYLGIKLQSCGVWSPLNLEMSKWYDLNDMI